MGKYSKGITNLRRYFVGGNWKCNGDTAFVSDFPTNVLNKLNHNKQMVEVVVAPTSLHISTVQKVINSDVNLAAQNISVAGMGAYTGELSANQAVDMGLKYTLVGHSERRTLFKETDEEAAIKVKAALE